MKVRHFVFALMLLIASVLPTGCFGLFEDEYQGGYYDYFDDYDFDDYDFEDYDFYDSSADDYADSYEPYADDYVDSYDPYAGSDASGGGGYGYDGTQSAWTVLLYLCGTDLESYSGAATYNLEELAAAQTSDDVNFLIQTGGTYEWWNYLVDSSSIQRWELDSGQFYLADEQPLSSMGAAETLGSFLSWGVSNYPAQNYMAIIWNHGGGSVSGVAFDELYNYDSLDLNELSEAFSMANAEFEIIGFDACLMASLETAAAIAPYGNYMVASEEYEPGDGWAYTELVNYLGSNPTADGKTVGEAICNAYFAKCQRYDSDEMATLSVVDLSKIDELVDSFSAMAVEMSGVTDEIDTYRTLINGINRAENYGGNTDVEGYTNMVDLGDLVMNTQDVLPDTADRVLNALFDAVVYNVHGSSRSNANGLSVFFPINSEQSELDGFAAIAPSPQYVRFIEVVSDWTAPPYAVAGAEEVESISSDDYEVEFYTFLDDDAFFTLVIESDIEAVAQVEFALFYLDYEYNECMFMGYDNDMFSFWEEGIFFDNFRGVWPTIEGCLCSPLLVSEEENYNLYSIPILLNGSLTNLRAVYIWEEDGSGHYEVLGAWDGVDSETGMSSRDLIKLKDGDVVTLLFLAADMDSGEHAYYETNSFVVDGEVVMEALPLPDGDYLYSYMITDVFGRIYHSDHALMECDDGTITVYETE
ncbi:MAG: clostripain-related cysteine peptidase [Clostridia bacterium]|nr:clostripain-related cysteine peptidase [Clostridia bacterium]